MTKCLIGNSVILIPVLTIAETLLAIMSKMRSGIIILVYLITFPIFGQNMDLPKDLTEFLKSKSELIYDHKSVEPDFVGIINFDKLELGKVWIEGNVSGKSYYEIPAINLTDKCEYYDPEYILLYLPNEKMYGTWDSDHWKLYVFPNTNWTEITEKPAEFINQQWNPKKEIGIEFDPKADYKIINGWPF